MNTAESAGLSTRAKIGLISAGVIFVVLIVVLACLYRRKHNRFYGCTNLNVIDSLTPGASMNDYRSLWAPY